MKILVASLLGLSLAACDVLPGVRDGLLVKGASFGFSDAEVKSYKDSQNAILYQLALSAGFNKKDQSGNVVPIDEDFVLYSDSVQELALLRKKANIAGLKASIKVLGESIDIAKKKLAEAVDSKPELQGVLDTIEALRLARSQKSQELGKAKDELWENISNDNSIKWQKIFEFGIDYVDYRCSQYMEAIFWARRSQIATGKEFSITNAVAAGLLGVFEAPLTALVALAGGLGFASSSLDVYYDSLLYQLDPSTVKGMVVKLQDAVRAKYAEPENYVVTKAAAIGGIREYLDKCLPSTIEAEVNKTLKESKIAITGVNGDRKSVDNFTEAALKIYGEIFKTVSKGTAPADAKAAVEQDIRVIEAQATDGFLDRQLFLEKETILVPE